ncbi:lactoylglutathione lyase [Pseudoalteromonas luteoviolacea]|uniref:lactoylglutathione lyase n=1 Tax=Pseudoalteromonas luteoviolacea TaxID=43657 RepID=UPI001B3A53FA|nr:lactoylglutathione lyase [Pseudoalteromonas luteoviolacea]MBQ4879967.1 lactoylglutathione lyase [Pseudoalteromonas luteoviolacea]MBQ4908984.1 lactoylglutathione lyase [Pseudoalteromonas luteoviolacea]
MKSNDIRPFIPVKELAVSKAFYEALGFTSDDANEDMSVISNGTCTFFLYQAAEINCGASLMFQLCVPDIQAALNSIQKVKNIDIRYEPIKEERWGKIIYLWGPSGEMWHINELNR